MHFLQSHCPSGIWNAVTIYNCIIYMETLMESKAFGWICSIRYSSLPWCTARLHPSQKTIALLFSHSPSSQILQAESSGGRFSVGFGMFLVYKGQFFKRNISTLAGVNKCCKNSLRETLTRSNHSFSSLSKIFSNIVDETSPRSFLRRSSLISLSQNSSINCK